MSSEKCRHLSHDLALRGHDVAREPHLHRARREMSAEPGAVVRDVVADVVQPIRAHQCCSARSVNDQTATLVARRARTHTPASAQPPTAATAVVMSAGVHTATQLPLYTPSALAATRMGVKTNVAPTPQPNNIAQNPTDAT